MKRNCIIVVIIGLALIAQMVRAFGMNPKVGGSSPSQVETFSVSKTLTLSQEHVILSCHTFCHKIAGIFLNRKTCFQYYYQEILIPGQTPSPLQWRHNGRDGVSNHQPHHCLLNRLFMRRSKKTSRLRVTGLRMGKFTGDRWIPRTNGQ